MFLKVLANGSANVTVIMPPRNDTASNVTLTDDNVNTTEEPPARMRGIDRDMHTVVLGLLIVTTKAGAKNR